MNPTPWDTIIVGAGPAGMSAALILGRCKRRVLLTDSGTPRSWAADRMHGFLSRDGIGLDDFREVCRLQLQAYPSVRFEPALVESIERTDAAFTVALAGGERAAGRKILLATGIFDELPPLPGIDRYFGKSAHPCPYCEGWEMRDLPTLVFGTGTRGFEMARAMTAWTSRLFLCTHGPSHLSARQRRELEASGIDVCTERIVELVGGEGMLEAVRFADGSERAARALFFDTPCHSQSALAASLGCRMSRAGYVQCRAYEATSVPGVYAAGNVLKDVHLSIVAAAEGARAAFGINLALTREDFARASNRRQRKSPARARSLQLPSA